MKNFILIFSFTALLAVTAGAFFMFAQPTSTPQFVDAEGKPVILPKDTKTYLHFWGSWCSPCVQELPLLDQYAGRRPDIAIYAIHSGPQSLAEIESTYSKLNIKHLKIYLDPQGSLSKHYKVHALPSTLEVGSDFQEMKRLTGPQQWQYYE